MMRALFALIILGFALPLHAGELWAKLWRNAEQQGEALMQQGDADAADRVYSDPRRKAYAKLKAGDYRGAAQDLQDLHDSDADYNRGNALAHAGDLQGALDAYDAALKSDPNNQDARHNRELVENALKQQPPQQQKSGDKQAKDDRQGDSKEGRQGKDSPEAEKRDGKYTQGEPDGQGKNGSQGKSGQAEKQPGKGQDSALQNKQEQQGKDGQQASEGKPREGMQGKAGGQPPAKDEAEQARRDAEASLAQAKKEKNGEGAAAETNSSGAMPGAATKSEKQIAQEQWLRSIPDDPGGLLRRKFMIEHMMRQQKAKK